jgi:hypothetical protein
MFRAAVVAVVLAVTVAVLATCDQPASAATGPCGQWRSTAIAVGFTSSQWPTVARIMWRESRCRPGARNRSGASGLMQIMPMWARHCHIPRAALFNGATNLRCARHVLRVQGWAAWR